MSDLPPIWDQPQPEPQPEPAARHRSPRQPSGLVMAVAVGGLILGVVATLVITSLGGSSHRTAAPVLAAPASVSRSASSPAPAPKTTATHPASKKPTSSAPVSMPPANETGLSHATPISVQIPKIGVSSSLLNLGLNSDGSLQVPTDFAKAGWYAQGAYPGDANEPPALIVGHVDNYKGPAVFYKLKQLGVGDRVLVPRADGTTATFVVYRTANYLKSAFPSESVYAATGRPELRLITCTGQFDSGARSYLSNFVAYAYLASGTS